MLQELKKSIGSLTCYLRGLSLLHHVQHLSEAITRLSLGLGLYGNLTITLCLPFIMKAIDVISSESKRVLQTAQWYNRVKF